jgi:hypothetical protein
VRAEVLRRKAEAEHRSMQQVAVSAIDAYVRQPTPVRRQAVPASELMEMFGDLPPIVHRNFAPIRTAMPTQTRTSMPTSAAAGRMARIDRALPARAGRHQHPVDITARIERKQVLGGCP